MVLRRLPYEDICEIMNGNISILEHLKKEKKITELDARIAILLKEIASGNKRSEDELSEICERFFDENIKNMLIKFAKTRSRVTWRILQLTKPVHIEVPTKKPEPLRVSQEEVVKQPFAIIASIRERIETIEIERNLR